MNSMNDFVLNELYIGVFGMKNGIFADLGPEVSIKGHFEVLFPFL